MMNSRSTGKARRRATGRRNRSGALVAACLTLALLATAGCGGVRNFENENDTLRRQNMDLAEQVEQLSQRLALRDNEIEALEQRADGGARPIEGARPPQLTKVRLDRYSGPIDTDGDGVDDLVRVYVKTLDQQGRFMPLAGRAMLRVVDLSPEREPATLAERVFEPAEFDRAYRSGMTGTHYTFEAPLPDALPEGLQRVVVNVMVTDAATGVSFSDAQEFPVRGH